MRLIFAGTPAFAEVALTALIAAGFPPVLVLTQPDRPSGRGLRPTPSAVKVASARHGLRIEQPETLTSERVLESLRSVNADVMVVAAYGLLLPEGVLGLFPRGCINIHASLLPRWRGAAPIQRAILAGDEQTGISIMRMEVGLDTGPILLTESTPICPDDTAATLHDRLARIGGEAIVRALEQIAAGQLTAIPQPAEGVTYARKIEKAETHIDWSLSAETIERQVRAFNPTPVASTTWRGAPLRVWLARPCNGSDALPGEVIEADANGIVVGCGEGTLRLLELQRAGGKRLPASAFLRGVPIGRGEKFGT